MKIGVLREIKNYEYCVGFVLVSVVEYVCCGYEVFVEKGVGEGSVIMDEVYFVVGVMFFDMVEEVWDVVDMIVKVKELFEVEYVCMKFC